MLDPSLEGHGPVRFGPSKRFSELAVRLCSRTLASGALLTAQISRHLYQSDCCRMPPFAAPAKRKFPHRDISDFSPGGSLAIRANHISDRRLNRLSCGLRGLPNQDRALLPGHSGRRRDEGLAELLGLSIERKFSRT